MSLKTATLIAIIGVGLGMVLSMLSPYIQQAILDRRTTQALSDATVRFYLNTFLQLRTLIHDGSLIVFLAVLLNRQK